MTRIFVSPWLVALVAFAFAFSVTSFAQTESVIHQFIPYSSGAGPSGLVADGKGNFYGTAGGGLYSGGVVFKLAPSSNGSYQSTILHNFGGTKTDGNSPWGGVILDKGGNLYGTTFYGGGIGNGNGIVFELMPAANGRWTEKILHTFGRPPDGANSFGGLVFDAAGNLYGTTSAGGSHSCEHITATPSCGTVFELSPNADGTWTETILYDFDGHAGGALPAVGLTIDPQGNLYGTTSAGKGTITGSVFELSPASTGWTFAVLHTFDANFPDGSFPDGLILDAKGNLYGTTYGGGYNGAGTVFEFVKQSDGSWNYTRLYSFSFNNGGYFPIKNLTMDSSGNLYGVTQQSGSGYGAIPGTIFELSPNSTGSWSATTLYTFKGQTDGSSPTTSLILGPSGNLFGMTGDGGWAQIGSFYSLAPSSDGQWIETQLYQFPSTDGINPTGLMSDGAGKFYGLTSSGGTSRGINSECQNNATCGTAYELTQSRDGSWQSTVIHNFSGIGADGGAPTSYLIQDSAGVLYGTTMAGGLTQSGTVFSLSRNSDGTWTETTLHSFGITPEDATLPVGPLVFDREGNLYGVTQGGGGHYCGTVFKLQPAGNGEWGETILFRFQQPEYNCTPQPGLVIDSEGNLYGTATGSGWRSQSVVFELSHGSWAQTILHNFACCFTDAYFPQTGLITDAKGDLFGSTGFGGVNGAGAVYEMIPTQSGGWSEQVLYSFPVSFDNLSAVPGAIVLDAAGNIYGTTEFGDANDSCFGGCATVYKLTPSSSGIWTEAILHSFAGGLSDGLAPGGQLVIDPSGLVYGTANAGGLTNSGVIYRITP